MLYPVQRKLSRKRMLSLLEELEASASSVCSLYFPPRVPVPEVEKTVGSVMKLEQAPADLSRQIYSSPTGAVLFWGDRHKYLSLPPFPIREKWVTGTCDVEPLRALLGREPVLALILVRLGAYGIGVFKGEKIVSSKVGTGLVHSRHRQGGSSAHRFERHREKQMESFFTRVCAHAREQLEPYARQLDFVIYGGTRETLLSFRKQCHSLREFDSRTLDRLLNIREPKQANLEEAIGDAWSSRLIEWREEEKVLSPT